MLEFNIIYFVIFSIPVFSAGLCFLILTFYRDGELSPVDVRLKRLLQAIFVLRIIGWSIVLCYFYNPPLYAQLSAIYFTINLVALVMLCNFIALITRTDPTKKFSIINYIIPVFFGILYQIEITGIPEDILVEVYTNRGSVVEGYETFSNKMNNGILIRGTYSLIYLVISVWNINRYRSFIVNYSTDIDRTSLTWVKLFIILMVVVSTLIGLGTSSITKEYPLILLMPIALLFFQHVLLCFNTCKRNYEIVWPQLSLASTVEDKEQQAEESKIDKKEFEDYIRENKPYLVPSLKITDMTRQLGTNRSYLSEFINTEYEMNFSTFINLCRLEEFEKIKNRPSNTLTNLDIIDQVGFGSYDSYLRTKKRRDAMPAGKNKASA